MNEEEYAKEMAKLEENESDSRVFPQGTGKPDTNIDEAMAKLEAVKQPNEVEKKLDEEDEADAEAEKEKEKIKSLPSLREFMKTEEFLRLGTKAKIPVPINMNGYEFKVFVRALSRNEIQACRVQAQHTDDDMDFLAVLKACTDEYGEPFDRETLDQLGYARIRDISEAIGIASGESPSNLESNIRKKVIDNFLQKIEDEA